MTAPGMAVPGMTWFREYTVSSGKQDMYESKIFGFPQNKLPNHALGASRVYHRITR